MVGHFKLKLWAFFWGQGERESPLMMPFPMFITSLKPILHVDINIHRRIRYM